VAVFHSSTDGNLSLGPLFILPDAQARRRRPLAGMTLSFAATLYSIAGNTTTHVRRYHPASAARWCQV